MNIDDPTIRRMFLDARTHYVWRPDLIADSILKQIYEIARMPPTSGNSNPMRVVFVRTAEGKQRLLPALKPGNVDKTMSAPITAILGFDLRFFDHFERLAPHAVERRSAYIDDPDLAYRAAFRNGTLQGAYFILAARSLGLDCGPMSGFLHDVVDREFFADGMVRSNFLVNLGHGGSSRLHPRAPRFEFDEVCMLA
jgi:3-hydroxypropanoate dehydrogenase